MFLLLRFHKFHFQYQPSFILERVWKKPPFLPRIDQNGLVILKFPVCQRGYIAVIKVLLKMIIGNIKPLKDKKELIHLQNS